MRLTEIKIHLCPPTAGRLKAFCSITFDHFLVVRDIKLIDGDGGLFLAMPSRKLTDLCNRCHEKNHLRALFCNNCGCRLDERRHENYRIGPDRLKLHADIAHPISARARDELHVQVMAAYNRELRLSHEPGYVPTAPEGELL
ncbi:MAG TPA: SpoVG family protein [Tepidisphaeraceae bacterium]|jgi:stage V sporulation protein G